MSEGYCPSCLAMLAKEAKSPEELETVEAMAAHPRPDWYIGSLWEIAEFFGVSVQTICNWRKKAREPMPGTHGRYYIPEIVQWAERHNYFH